MLLPIDATRPQVMEALGRLPEGGRLVLSAPTGSGKSTRLPVWCREAGLGPVLVIEPRRLACRTLAGWVAAQAGEPVGQSVGYSIRYEQRYSEATSLLFVTPGVARRFLTEGRLETFGTVIFDEFHERGWETDTVMAVLAGRPSRQRLLLMSATLAAERLAQFYGAERLESSGRTFPVSISHLREDGVVAPSAQRLSERVARAIEANWDRDGGTLVFLPGLAAMREVQQRLPRLPVRLLHGTFAQQRQDSAFSDDAPRIVLATNVAESSLTVPGITTVIDSGLEKRPVHQAGYVALGTVPIALSSADQRAGRAGRTAPGRCLRMWDPAAKLVPQRAPDLERMELDELLMFLAGLEGGVHTPLRWLDPPPAFAWDRALERLQSKDLVGADGRSSELGKMVERLPVETSWARVLALAPPHLRGDLCDLHAFSTGRRGLLLPSASEDQVQHRKEDLGEEPWRRALSLLRVGEPGRHGLDSEALSEARRLSRELRQILAQGEAEGGESGRAIPHPELGLFLARTWPERHFLRRATRDAWGNGQVECRLRRGEELLEECIAAVMLQVEPVMGRGLKVELRGGSALPSTPSLLRQAGYGEPELSKLRWKDGKLWARVAWSHVGRVLGTEERELEGAALRLALLQKAREKSWRPGLWEAWEEYGFYADLQLRLQGVEPAEDTSTRLLGRLSQLGLEQSEELELLEERDLMPSPPDEELKKLYPRIYLYGGVSYDTRFRPGKVTLVWRSGPKGAPVSAQHLPRWNGWRVDLDERGRVTPLR